jgi:endonuclease VIII
MAEGDSILRLSRRFEHALAGRPLSVRTPGRRRPEGLATSELEGRVLERVESRGKHLLLHFEEGLALHSHLGMRGTWHLHPVGRRWRFPRASAWLALSDGSTEAVNFGGSTLLITTEARLWRDPRLARLGPDLLADDFDAADVARAARAAGPDTELGEALLDQTLVAGIGNIFKSEGCFAAGIDPWRRLGALEDDELAAVLVSTRELMLASAEERRRGRNAVYRRAGEPCPRCRGRILSRPQGVSARVTYWCPDCQSRD